MWLNDMLEETSGSRIYCENNLNSARNQLYNTVKSLDSTTRSSVYRI